MSPLSKTQIDRLGERLKKGEVSDDDLRLLNAYRGSFAEAYQELVAIIRNATQLEPKARPAKSTTSIIAKLKRQPIRLSRMQDVAGCRLIVRDSVEQNQIVERLKTSLAKAVVVDRRKKPSHGYRAVHIIATVRNQPIEIQVRTEVQHLWAQLSEKLSDSIDPAIKYGGGDSEIQKFLSALSSGFEHLEDLELQRDTAEVARGFNLMLRQLLELGELVFAARKVRRNDLSN
ncbi:MAG: hypothetical protein ACLQOO_15710 [Terriglobia bacterium]